MMTSDDFLPLYKLGSCLAHINDVAKYKLDIPQDRANHLRDAYSHGQLLSKIAALKHVSHLSEMNTIVLGQWHGLLAHMFGKFGISKSTVGIELDEFWHDFCLHLNLPNYTGVCGDATDSTVWTQYLQPSHNLVVNTSCEHMSWDWLDFERGDTCGYVYAQANNYVIPEHVNTCQSLREFVDAFASRGYTIHSEVELKFAPYNRYCVLASWN